MTKACEIYYSLFCHIDRDQCLYAKSASLSNMLCKCRANKSILFVMWTIFSLPDCYKYLKTCCKKKFRNIEKL